MVECFCPTFCPVWVIFSLLERLFSCDSKSVTAAHVRDHSTAIICFAQKFNGLCFNVGCHVFRNRHCDASVYFRKLDFQENLCEAFVEDKKAALLWRLSFGMGSFAKDCLQLLVNRISIKTLEK